MFEALPPGSRSFNLSTITRNDPMSLIEECGKVAGIPYVMRAYRKAAREVLAQRQGRDGSPGRPEEGALTAY